MLILVNVLTVQTSSLISLNSTLNLLMGEKLSAVHSKWNLLPSEPLESDLITAGSALPAKKIKHEHAGPQKLPQGGLGHLEVPWVYLLASKLKIYVETICCEHFVFFENNIFVSNFSNFIL